jgi:protein ImuB
VDRVTRYACVLVPHFAAAAAERAEPGLRERPLAIVTGAPPATRVVEANAAAREHGVMPGMPEAEGRTRCPVLALRPATPELIDSSRQALLQACLAVSPRIEEAAPGIVHVEIEGLSRLFGPDRSIADRLARLAGRVGLPARVGVADSRVAARAAARQARARGTVVPPGGDRQSLAPAPLDALELSGDLLATLARWGLTTLGELAALPRKGLGDRLGAAGLRAHDLAHGRDLAPFRPYSPPPFWEEALGLDWEIDALPVLAVALEMVLARLTARLAAARLAADAISLRLGLATGGEHDQLVSLAYPLRESGPMLALLRLALEAHPPPAPVIRIAVSASAVALRPAPRELWEPAGPAPRDLETVLARLITLATPQNVGSPVITDSHRADAFVLAPFVPPGGGRLEKSGMNAEEGAGTGRRNLEERGMNPDAGVESAERADGRAATPLALRRLRPPRRIEVTTDGTARAGGRRPARIIVAGRAPVRVIACAGPWRITGEWWDAHPWSRDEWDVELADGLVCRLVRDRIQGHWYLDGVYD